MALEEVHLKVEATRHLKEILEKVPNWYPICISDNDDPKKKYRLVGVVVNKTLRKRKEKRIVVKRLISSKRQVLRRSCWIQ